MISINTGGNPSFGRFAAFILAHFQKITTREPCMLQQKLIYENVN